MRGRNPFGLIVCGAVLLALAGVGLQLQRHDHIGWFVAVAVAQGAVYLLAVWIARRPGSRRTLWLILGVAAALRVVLVFTPPYLSTDIYRYVWDGRVIAAGINPYRYIPTDPHLKSLQDFAIFPNINRNNYAHTIYPPAAEAVFFLVTRVSESVTAMKLGMIAFEAVAIGLLLVLLASSGQPASRIIVYAWHPLPLWEFAGSGHVDALVVFFVALALWSSTHKSASFRGAAEGCEPGTHEHRPLEYGFRVRRFAAPRNDKFLCKVGLWSRRRATGWLTGLALAGGTLVKFYPAAIFPALWRRWEWRMPAIFAAALLFAYLPFLGVGSRVLGFLPGYLAEEGFTAGGGGFYLSNVAKSWLGMGGVIDIAYVALAALLLGVLALYVAFRHRSPDNDVSGAALLAGAIMLLLSPHYPWYFTWLVVFACLVPSAALLWLTLASFLLYLVPVRSQLIWDRPRFIVESALYLPFLLLAAAELWRQRRREQAKHGDYADR